MAPISRRGLVLVGGDTRESCQLAFVVALLDDRRSEVDEPVASVEFDLLGVEPEFVEPVESLADRGELGLADVLGHRQVIPQRGVPVVEAFAGPERVDPWLEGPGGLQVEQAAYHVLHRDLQIEGPLATTELVVDLGGLGVHGVGPQRSGVSPEERIVQGAVAPEDPAEVEPDEQDGERIDQLVGDRRDIRGREEVGVGDRVPEMFGDQHCGKWLTRSVMPLERDTDQRDRRDAQLPKRREHIELADRKVVRELLEGSKVVRRRHEPHHVAVVPCGEDDRGLVGPVLER